MHFLITSLIAIAIVISPYMYNKYKNISEHKKQSFINKLEGTICWTLAMIIIGLTTVGGLFIFIILKG